MGVEIGGVALGERPRIVAAGGERELDALAAAGRAHLVEIRADLFDAPTPARVADAVAHLRRAGRPVILTVRRPEEGGGALAPDLRRAIYEATLSTAAAIDVEIASADLLAALRPALGPAGPRLILSTHDLARTPPVPGLQIAIDRGRTLGADVVKVATRTDRADDLHRLLGLTLANRAAGIVTLGMGAWGPLSRVALPAAGSWLTYASVGEPTAPGQLPLDELATIIEGLYDGT